MLLERTIANLREFRRANSTLFTVQVCGTSLVLAFVASFFSGFTLAFLVEPAARRARTLSRIAHTR